MIGRRTKRIRLAAFVADQYTQRIAGLSPNARARYISQLNCHVMPHLGDVALDRIDLGTVQAFIATLLKADQLAASSITSVGRLLLRVLAVADAHGFTTCRVDARDVQWPRSQTVQAEARWFCAQDVERILEAANGWLKALFSTLAWSGLRIGEALGLDWGNLSLDAGVMRVRQQASRGEIKVLKSASSRADLPLDGRLQTLLIDFWKESGQRQSGLVFGRYGFPRSSSGVADRHLTPLLAKLQIPHAGPHAFRHAFCSSLWAAGLDADTIRRLMRHSTLAQTLKYSHAGAHALRSGINRVSNAQIYSP